jgi:hypothetical protein
MLCSPYGYCLSGHVFNFLFLYFKQDAKNPPIGGFFVVTYNLALLHEVTLANHYGNAQTPVS